MESRDDSGGQSPRIKEAKKPGLAQGILALLHASEFPNTQSATSRSSSARTQRQVDHTYLPSTRSYRTVVFAKVSIKRCHVLKFVEFSHYGYGNPKEKAVKIESLEKVYVAA